MYYKGFPWKSMLGHTNHKHTAALATCQQGTNIGNNKKNSTPCEKLTCPQGQGDQCDAGDGEKSGCGEWHSPKNNNAD